MFVELLKGLLEGISGFCLVLVTFSGVVPVLWAIWLGVCAIYDNGNITLVVMRFFVSFSEDDFISQQSEGWFPNELSSC